MPTREYLFAVGIAVTWLCLTGCGRDGGDLKPPARAADVRTSDRDEFIRLDRTRQAAVGWWIGDFREPIPPEVEGLFHGHEDFLKHLREAWEGKPIDFASGPGSGGSWVETWGGDITFCCKWCSYPDPFGWTGHDQVIVMAITDPMFVEDYIPPYCCFLTDVMIDLGPQYCVGGVELRPHGDGFSWSLEIVFSWRARESMPEDAIARGKPTIVGSFDGKRFTWSTLTDEKGEYPLDKLPEAYGNLMHIRPRVSQSWPSWW